MSSGGRVDLSSLFYPRSVAVIGASPHTEKLRWGGKSFIDGLIKQNYRGKIYPVNPRAERVLGLKAYKRVTEIHDDVDLAIFSVPPSAVLKVMDDCARKRAG